MRFHNQTITAGGSNDTSVKLKTALAKRHFGPDGYELDLTYRLDCPTATQELRIPRLLVPLNTDVIKIYGFGDCSSGFANEYSADLGFGEMKLLPDENGAAYIIKTIEEKPKEMTLDEIEKKLGHKVKIVNK